MDRLYAYVVEKIQAAEQHRHNVDMQIIRQTARQVLQRGVGRADGADVLISCSIFGLGYGAFDAVCDEDKGQSLVLFGFPGAGYE